ncbi:MAG: autotransporter assembly complex protein TamA [Granulosicoccus sp.]|nr:autotransporter assembly complex protein TamA [Granulosicoccus sp.]
MSSKHIRSGHLLLMLAALIYATTLFAQSENNPTVSVSIAGVEDELLSNVQGFLPLFRFNGKEAPSVGRVRLLHSQANEAITQALAPFGYYRATVVPTLAKVDDVWTANYVIDPGDQILLVAVDISVTGEASADKAFKEVIQTSTLKVGTPLLHVEYESLKQEFQLLGSERGYFDAQMKENQILIDLKKYEASVVLHFESGERYFLGDVNFNQDRPWLRESMLGRFSEIKPGQAYLANDLQKLQSDLSNTEYYDEVVLDVSPESANDDNVIPVDVNLTARNPTRYTFGAGYGTDTGARVKAGITRRRVNEAGHHFSAESILAELRYGIAGEYIIPGSDPRTDSWGLRASLEDENSSSSDYTSLSLGGFYRHRDRLWIKTYALDYLVEEFEVLDEENTSELLIPSVEWTRTFPQETEKRLYVTSGTQLRLSVRGGADSVLSDTNFIQPMISGKWIHSFVNRTRLIARGAAGTTSVSDFEQLPTSLRFFTGGDKSLRGFGYKVIGPEIDGDVVGGKNLLESSLELEIPFSEQWSVALFGDIGDAFDDSPDYKSGVGAGLHWRSPIGPVRLDFGHAFDVPPGRNLRAHLTIGADL